MTSPLLTRIAAEHAAALAAQPTAPASRVQRQTALQGLLEEAA